MGLEGSGAGYLYLLTIHADLCRPGTSSRGDRITATNTQYQYSGTAWVEIGALGAWTAWAGTFSGSTNVTVTFARYFQVGKSVTWQALMTSAAAPVSSAEYRLTMPIAERYAGNQSFGSGWAYAGGGWSAIGVDRGAANAFRFISTNGPMSNTVMTFTGASQIIAVGGTYEAA